MVSNKTQQLHPLPAKHCLYFDRRKQIEPERRLEG